MDTISFTAYTRLMSYVAGAVLVLAFIWIVYVHGLPADFLTRNALSGAGLIGTISVAALWQIAVRALRIGLLALHAGRDGCVARILGQLLGLLSRFTAAHDSGAMVGSCRTQGQSGAWRSRC